MKDGKFSVALIGLLGLCFSACVESVDEPILTDQTEIDPKTYISFAAPHLTFESGVSGFTRAELVDEISQFTVYGYCVPRNLAGELNYVKADKGWEEKASNFTQRADVLDGYVVKIDGDNTYYDKGKKEGINSYEETNPQEWYTKNDHPDADDFNYAFIATATPSGSFTMSHENDINKGYPVLTFDMPRSESTNINTVLDYTQQPDALIGTKFDQFNNSKVKLSFEHIMTGLRFRFYNECTATETERKDLVIHKVTFSGTFYKQARFIFDSEKMRSEIVQKTVMVNGEEENQPITYSGTFVLLDKDQKIAAGRSDMMRHDGDPNGRTVKLLLLPNTNATLDPSTDKIDDWALGTNKTITIEYSINGVRKKPFVLDKLQLKYIPDVNTLHTANFHFVGDDFIVTFQADNEWSNGCDSKLEIH